MDPHQRTVATAVLAGMTVPALVYSVYCLCRRPSSPSGGGAGKDNTALATYPETTHDVCNWLAQLGVSQQTRTIFAAADIDGNVLSRLTAQWLARMGVSLQDRVLVLGALASLEPSGHSHGSHFPEGAEVIEPRRAKSDGRVVSSFLGDAEALFADMVCLGDDGQNMTAEDARQDRVSMAARLFELLEAFQALPQDRQHATMLPLAKRLNSVLTRPTPRPTPRTPFNPSQRRSVGGTQTVAVPTEEFPEMPYQSVQPAREPEVPATAVQSLDDMVDSFLKLLLTPELDDVTASDFEPLANRIAAQISRVSEVASRLPPALGQPLVAKCGSVRQLLVQRAEQIAARETEQSRVAEKPSAEVRADEDNEMSSAAPLVVQLRKIFERARDPAFLQADPRERLPAIEQLIDEVESIRTVLAELPRSSQSKMGMEISANVLGLLEQLRTLTQDEARFSTTEGERQGTDEEGELAEADAADEDSDDFDGVTASFLRRIEEVLQSSTFAAASSEAKHDILRTLSSRVLSLGTEARELPAAHRQSAMAAVAQAQRLLAEADRSVDDANAADAGANARDEERVDNSGDDDDDDDKDGSERESTEDAKRRADKAPLSKNDAESILDVAVTQIESVFALLNSERFENASVEEKRSMAGALLKRVEMLKAPIMEAIHGDSSHPIVTELLGPLEDLLDSMAHIRAPSSQFGDIADTLKEMSDVLSSRALSQVPPAKQVTIAKAIVNQLQRVASTLPGLSPSERQAAERLIAPINAKLVALIRGNGDSSTIGEKESESHTNEGAEEDEEGGDDEADVEEEEEAREENPPARADRQSIVSQLRQIMSTINANSFEMATAAARAAVATDCVRKLGALQVQCRSLPPESQEQLLPIVNRLLTQLQALQEVGKRGNASEPSLKRTARAQAAPSQSVLQDQRDNLFASVKDITQELRSGRQRGIKLGAEELAPLQSLVEMMNTVKNLTSAESAVRRAFDEEIEAAGEGASGGEQPPEEEANAARELPQEPSARKRGGDAAKPGQGPVDSFLKVFKATLNALNTREFPSVSQLLPVMSIVESTLQSADEQGIDWRSNPDAVRTVSSVLARIKELQEEVQQKDEKNSTPSYAASALKQATEKIHANPPRTRAELLPYLELLQKLMNADAVQPEDMKAMEALKDAIIACGARLNGTGEDNAEAEKPNTDSRVADALLEMSDKLRDSNLSNEELNGYEAVVNQLSNATKGKADFEDAIQSVREQIHLQRVLNSPTSVPDERNNDREETKSASHADTERASNRTDSAATRHDASKSGATRPSLSAEEQLKNAFKEDDGDASSIAVDAATGTVDLQDLADDGVPGGSDNELSLLPKIEDRIALSTDSFIAGNSLFDIQTISKVLLHMSSENDKVSKDAALKKRIDAAKTTFISQLAAFRSADHASSAAEASKLLKVTGEETTNEDGTVTRNLIIFTTEEEESHPVNEKLLRSLQEAKNVSSPTIKREIAASWKGKSTAFLVYAHEGAPEDETEHPTALAELVLLHETLTKRYGFDVVTITDALLTSQGLLKMIQDAVETSPGRLLVYFCTPPSRDAVAVPLAMTFHDESVLEYSTLLERVGSAAERVTIVHSMPRKLEVVAHLKGKTSPVMRVTLTSKAAAEIAKLRCWLYDGIFTPVVVELLCRDERLMLCPEDVVNYAVTATTRMTIEFGSFTESEPAGMAFFLPADNVTSTTFKTA